MQLYIFKIIKSEVESGRDYWLTLKSVCDHFKLDDVIINSSFQDYYPELHPDGARPVF